MKDFLVKLPDTLTYRGFAYVLSDDPLKDSDWYIDHQKYNWGLGNAVEEVNQEGLAEFINNGGDGIWHSRKIIATDNPLLNKLFA